MNMPGRATPSEITPISYFGRRRYRLFTFVGDIFVVTLHGIGRSTYTSTYIQSTVAYNIYWVLLGHFLMGDAGVHFAQQNDRTKARICQLRIGNAKRREISCINTKYE